MSKNPLGRPLEFSSVAKATRYVDLGPKLTDYKQAGVAEYIVRALKPGEIVWCEQRRGSLTRRDFGADGLY
jgi:hypothetical protein